MNMMTELCQNLRNWFDRGQKKWHGKITISNGVISFEPLNASSRSESIHLIAGQYYRIIGSLFNDGVHVYKGTGDSDLVNETFEGSIWGMAIPPAVIDLCQEIEEWQNKYGGADSRLMSPYSSESFMGYSYTKSSGSSASNGAVSSATVTWKDMYASRINPWRKI